ncbi:hypothetical protein ACP70R_028613 [Stipagrostis hirtigluma subsp. patula]
MTSDSNKWGKWNNSTSSSVISSVSCSSLFLIRHVNLSSA